jgi:hypothetical protein
VEVLKKDEQRTILNIFTLYLDVLVFEIERTLLLY